MKTNKENKINGWDIWTKNFFNAQRFFESKDNIRTRSRFKDKWFRVFKKDLEDLDVQLHNQQNQETIKELQKLALEFREAGVYWGADKIIKLKEKLK